MSRKSISLDMEPEDFASMVESLDPLELQGLYVSLQHAKHTVASMIALVQMEVMERVMSGEADPEIANPDGVTLQ